LYADWEKRDSLLVTKRQFMKDLKNNYQRMRSFNISKNDALYFLPPFEWYNQSITNWTNEAGHTLVNFTSGTLSTADYTYPEMPRFRSSEEIFQSIIHYEQKDPYGLNGFILLMHIGTDPRRKDKFYYQLEPLLEWLKAKGYSFERIDTLLDDERP
jgi:peptidoglycan/xylan/chitin deacetylase (PgdA/CDA1 family)